MINTLKEIILKDLIEVHYKVSCTSINELDTSIEYVVFKNNDLNNFVEIIKGDDFLYHPIDPNEINEVDSQYILNIPEYNYDPEEKNIQDNYIPTGNTDIMLMCQPNYWYVNFKFSTGKLNKFETLDKAISYALSNVKNYLESEFSNVEYLILRNE